MNTHLKQQYYENIICNKVCNTRLLATNTIISQNSCSKIALTITQKVRNLYLWGVCLFILGYYLNINKDTPHKY